MNWKTNRVEKKDEKGTVALNRPERFNTFSTKLALELNESLRQLDVDLVGMWNRRSAFGKRPAAGHLCAHHQWCTRKQSK